MRRSSFAAELRRAGIRGPSGAAITPTLVLRWRDATGGGASDLTEQTYDSMRQKLANLPAEAVATPLIAAWSSAA